MLRSRRTFCIATTAFVAAVSMSLTACGDSSAPTIVDQSMFETACTAENEGMIDSIENHYGKYGYAWDRDYFRCEKGSWRKKEFWVRCAKDAQKGDACIYSYGNGTTMTVNEIYTYTSNGGWKLYGRENDLGKFTIHTDEGRKTAFYKSCIMEGWCEIDEEQYSCFSKFDVQDTCMLETDEGKNYYLTQTRTDITHLPVWIKIDYDPELGFCSFHDYQKKGKKEGKYYYCSQNGKGVSRDPKWIETELFPQQDNDSRKNGLTDEEYDILDLPKETSTGDLVGGLLEVCFYNQEIETTIVHNKGLKKFTLDFCIPQNYYRYENGSWTLDAHYRNKDGMWILQTNNEVSEVQENNRCTQETEGAEIITLPRVHASSYTDPNRFAEPGAIYQCVSGRKELKEYTYGRYGEVEEVKFFEEEENDDEVEKED